MKYPLMPLQIPSGWIVVKNIFYDVDSVVQDSVLEDPDIFTEDLLFLQRNVGPEREDQFMIDLGWVPPRNASGTYRAVIIIESWENVIKEFESRDRNEIQRVLNQWLDVLSCNFNVEDALRELSNIK
jgi:hypothetical protein